MTTQTSKNTSNWLADWPWPQFPPTAALLLTANFIPLIGVIAWQWSPLVILVLYWLENVTVGVTTAMKMLLCRGKLTRLRIPSTLFFAVHYGMFTLVHGVFVFALGEFIGQEYYGPQNASYRWWLLGLTALTMIGAHVFDFVFDFIIEGRGRNCSPLALMWRPYPRMIVLHVAIVLGIFLSVSLGAAWPVIALLVVLKTLADLGLQLAFRVNQQPILDSR